MKQSLSELRIARDSLAEQAREVNGRYPPNSAMPRDISNQLDDLLNKIDATDRDITAHLNAAQNTTGDGWRGNNGDLKVLRTASDIRAHYANLQRGQVSAQAYGDQPMRLDDFVRGIAGMKTTPGVHAALSVGTDTSGGYAVPTILMPDILQALVPASSLMQAGAGIVPLDNGGKSFTTAAVSVVPTAGWRLESGTVVESDPTFRAVTSIPHSLAFYFKTSRELLADAQNMTAAMTIAIAQAFAKAVDRAGLRGTGTAPEPRGLLNTSGIASVANGANGTALGSYANILSAYQAVLQADGPMPTAAIMSPRSQIKLAGLVDTIGQPVQKPQLLLPMKLLATSQVPNNLTVGSSTDCSEIYLGDFTQMAFMMREQMSMQILKEQFALTGELAFLCHMRMDVAVMYPAAFAVVTGVRP